MANELNLETGITKPQYDNDLMAAALDKKLRDTRNKKFADETQKVDSDINQGG